MSVPDWWCQRVSDLYDLPPREAREILGLVEDPSCWLLAEMPGMLSLRIPVGPRRAGATATIFLAEPYAEAPEHLHEGEERVIVLQGSYWEADGRKVAAGDEVVWGSGTRHSVRVGPDGCLCAVLVSP